MDKESIKLGLILCAITLSVSVILAFANGITKPIIEGRNSADTTHALSVVLEAESYEIVTLPQGAGANVKEVYAAKNGSETIGYCVQVAPSGYGGEIMMIVGVAQDKITGVSITNMNETPGLGTLVNDPEYTNQYKDKSAPFKVNKDGGDIQAISGATISSKAVSEGVNQAAETAKILAGGAS